VLILETDACLQAALKAAMKTPKPPEALRLPVDLLCDAKAQIDALVANHTTTYPWSAPRMTPSACPTAKTGTRPVASVPAEQATPPDTTFATPTVPAVEGSEAAALVNAAPDDPLTAANLLEASTPADNGEGGREAGACRRLIDEAVVIVGRSLGQLRHCDSQGLLQLAQSPWEDEV
jgi:hypothetical protein